MSTEIGSESLFEEAQAHIRDAIDDWEILKIRPPASLSQLCTLAQDESVDLTKVVELAQSDTSLVARLLSLANSAMAGGRVEIDSVERAVIRLGLSTVSTLAMVLWLQDAVLLRGHFGTWVRKVWSHSSGVALGSAALMRHWGKQPAPAFTGGLLHDIGHVVVCVALHEQPMARSLSEPQVGRLATTLHCTAGERAVHEWSLPETVAEVVAGHHTPATESAPLQLDAVRLADLSDQHFVDTEERESQLQALLQVRGMVADELARALGD